MTRSTVLSTNFMLTYILNIFFPVIADFILFHGIHGGRKEKLSTYKVLEKGEANFASLNHWSTIYFQQLC